MPYNHRRPKVIINILTILGMIIVTSVVTLLCIRFGMIMTTTPTLTGKVYHTTDNRSIAQNRGKLLVVTIPPDTTVELNATDNSISQDQQESWISLPASNLSVPENQSLTNYLSFNNLQQENSRSLTDIGLVQADSFLIEQSTSKSVARPIDIRDKSINTNPSSRNGHITTMGNNSENNDEDVTDNNNMYQINGRQISRRKINHNHQLKMKTAKYSTVAEDSSNGYKNAYDLTYNVGDYGHKENENPVYEGGWTSAGRPEQAQGSLWSGSSGSWEPPPYETGEGYLVDQGPSRKPFDRPLSNPTKNDLSTSKPKLNNINWRAIAILALFKLGLAKLQAIGFFNTLFQIGFSFKLYMTAVLFNFLLIMKLMKFFKILLLPLFLARLLPLFIQLLMIPGRLFNLMRRTDDNNMMPVSQPGALSPSQPGGLLPNQPSGLLPSQPGGLIPNRQPGIQPDGARPGGARSGGLLPNQQGSAPPSSTQWGGMFREMGKEIPNSLSAAANYNIDSNTTDSLYKLEDTHLNNIQGGDSTQLSDPILDIFQKLLDSEKCVERIACRISVAEKILNIPIWINWVLHRVHKFIPSDKLESYLKAYKDVHDAIHAKSSVTDNWVTWCLEHYNCDSSDNTTNSRQ